MSKVKIGDVVMLGEKIAVICEITDRPKNDLTVRLDGGLRRYKCSSANVKVVGKVDMGLFEKKVEVAKEVEFINRKVGDKMKVMRGVGVVEVEFVDYNLRCYKRPVTYRYNGKLWKTTVASVVM